MMVALGECDVKHLASGLKDDLKRKTKARKMEKPRGMVWQIKKDGSVRILTLIMKGEKLWK